MELEKLNCELQSNNSPFAFSTDSNDDQLLTSSTELSLDSTPNLYNSSDTLFSAVSPVAEKSIVDLSLESTVDIGPKSPVLAATKLQKVYRSYRTRRRLADSVVVAEELCHTTISFFDYGKSETAVSRWNRIGLNASKVGKGLSKDEKAKKLAFQHWIEAIDPRHRYGHSLHLYYNLWANGNAGQPFFYWLDVGDGKDIDLPECPRSKLRQQCITYLGPHQRDHYEYIVVDGRFVHKQSEELLDTTKVSKGAKWIFVMSTFKKLYAGEKKKGVFHHSSFLAGGATLAAGRLVVIDGVLKSISAYSGHYRPTDDNLASLVNFLKEHKVNFDDVEVRSSTDDYEYNEDSKSKLGDSKSDLGDSKSNLGEIVTTLSSDPAKTKPMMPSDTKPFPLKIPAKRVEPSLYGIRTPHGGLQSPRPDVPRNQLLRRINSKKVAKSYQLGHQLSLKWSSGAGPRIGCVADYPQDVRDKALEFVNLSPRILPTPRQYGNLYSPMPRAS
ncbi:IQ domain-containing protein iqm3 [Ranunculus cassubicifolius]